MIAFGCLYVDNFLISYRVKDMNIIERQLQLWLNKIEKGQWRMDLNSLAQKLLVCTFVITELNYIIPLDKLLQKLNVYVCFLIVDLHFYLKLRCLKISAIKC